VEKDIQKWRGRFVLCIASTTRHVEYAIVRGLGAFPQENFENYTL